MISERDTEKLKAIGYVIKVYKGAKTIDGRPIAEIDCIPLMPPMVFSGDNVVERAWAVCETHAKSAGLKATMADKVRWLINNSASWVEICTGDEDRTFYEASLPDIYEKDAQGGSPEAAVDALFWKVP